MNFFLETCCTTARPFPMASHGQLWFSSGPDLTSQCRQVLRQLGTDPVKLCKPKVFSKDEQGFQHFQRPRAVLSCSIRPNFNTTSACGCCKSGAEVRTLVESRPKRRSFHSFLARCRTIPQPWDGWYLVFISILI